MEDLEFEVEYFSGKISAEVFADLLRKKVDDPIEFDAEITEADSLVDVNILIHKKPEFLVKNGAQKIWIQISGSDPTIIEKGKTVTLTGKISKQKPILTV